ncbi:MAG TPA: glycosyltransferase [Anaerolineales bacterium]
MTVAYILKMYPRFSETFILNEILELERQGVQVQIYSLVKPNDGRFHASLAKVQAKVTYLPEYPRSEFKAQVWPAWRNLLRRDAGRFWKIFWYALSHRNGVGLKQFMRACVLADRLLQEPVEHLHAHFASSATSVAMIAHLFTGIPYSFTAHAKDIYLKSIDPNLQRDKLTQARFVVTVSDFNKDYLSGLVNGQGPSGAIRRVKGQAQPSSQGISIRRLYNGINLEQFHPAPLPAANHTNRPLILSVGRLVEKKGFEDLILACAELHTRGLVFKCEIIGKGPREAALRELIARLDLSGTVRLVGPRPQDEIVSSYQNATIFALPCVVGEDGNRDGLPTVLLEAMATGLPVVSTQLTGIPEIVDDGETGLLVPEHDPAALANALASLLADPASRNRMGRQAQEKVNREFDLRKNVAVLRQWYAGAPEQATWSGTPLAAHFIGKSADEHTLPVR